MRLARAAGVRYPRGPMHDTPPAESAPDFSGKPWALRLGAGLGAAFALTVAFALFDGTRRTSLEAAAELTAVGDAVFFQMPEPPPKPRPATPKWAGQPLFPVSLKACRVADSDMRRVAKDEATGLTIYEPGPDAPKTEEVRGKNGERGYFLKLAPGQFLKVGVSAPR